MAKIPKPISDALLDKKFTCAECGVKTSLRRSIGKRECKQHPGKLDFETDRYSCCGWLKAPGLLGCSAGDHRGPMNWPINGGVPLSRDQMKTLDHVHERAIKRRYVHYTQCKVTGKRDFSKSVFIISQRDSDCT